jgi:ribosomal protein S21
MLFELQQRERYTKPSVERKMAKSMAKKRWQKYLQQNNFPNSN